MQAASLTDRSFVVGAVVQHASKEAELKPETERLYKIVGIDNVSMQVELEKDGKKERVDFSTLLDHYKLHLTPPPKRMQLEFADLPDICCHDDIQSEVAKSRLFVALIDLHKKRQPEVTINIKDNRRSITANKAMKQK